MVGLRGAMPAPSDEDKLPYMFDAPRNRHLGQPFSPKPGLLAEHIDRIYPPPLVKIELSHLIHQRTRSRFETAT